MSLDLLCRVGLWILGITFLVVGLLGWFSPDVLFGPIGVPILTADGRAEIRAAYGGHFVSWGVVFAVGATHERWRTPALIGASMVVGGFVFGRVWSMAVDGIPGTVGWVNLCAESFGAVTAGVLAWLRSRAPSPTARSQLKS